MRRRSRHIILKIILIIAVFFIGYTIGRGSNKNEIVLTDISNPGGNIVADLSGNVSDVLSNLTGNISPEQLSGIVTNLRNSGIATYLTGIARGFINTVKDIGINLGQ